MTRLQTIIGAFACCLLFTQPALACMDHEGPFIEPEPVESEPESEEEPSDDDQTEGQVQPVLVEPLADLQGVAMDAEVCEGDRDCPAGLLCEPVACCEAEDCVCPAQSCVVADTGAQGRECLASSECGEGFECVDAAPSPCPEGAPCSEEGVGWCEAIAFTKGEAQALEPAAFDGGCQGGGESSPLALGLIALFSLVWVRRSQTS